MTLEGTGTIPTEGLYDTVYDWDLTIEMAGGVTMTFKPGPDYTKFIGEEGWVGVARHENRSSAYPASLQPLGGSMTSGSAWGHHGQNFVDCVKSRSQPVSSLADAVRSDNISQLSDIAVRLGRKVTWDPVQEEIVGDAEAAKMLSRPMREPWTL